MVRHMSWVYVIKSQCGPVKIGVAKSVKHRLAVLRAGIPLRKLEVEQVWKFRAQHWAMAVERAAHKVLAQKSICKEWFTVTPKAAVKAVDDAIRKLDAMAKDHDEVNDPRPLTAIEAAKQSVVLSAYVKNEKNVSRAAAELKMHRRTVQRILRRIDRAPTDVML